VAFSIAFVAQCRV